MVREIEYNNLTIKYELQYKKVKNINLRVKPDCSINVSANKRVSIKTIDEFVLSKADFIIYALDKYANMPKREKKQYFAENEIRTYILNLCQEVYPYFESMGVEFPTIRFRKMVSQWGSCHSQKGILTFNTNLMYTSPECVRYVVLHEFTHFLQPNHSRAFYEELKKTCPDWKVCRNKLKEINIR